MKEAWERSSKSMQIKFETLSVMISQVFRGKRLIKAERTQTGLSNGTYKVEIEGSTTPYLLRIFSGGSDIAIKEKAIAERLRGVVPVADYIYLDTSRKLVEYDWALMEWKEGVLLRDILQRREERQIAEVAESVGNILARIHSHTFESPGLFAGDLTIAHPFDMDENEFFSFITESLDHSATRHWLGAEATEKVRSFCVSHRSLLSEIHEPPVLVHSDFNGLNLLMMEGLNGFEVSAVLDWEFAFSGRRYVDIGNMLRYEHDKSLFERHFVKAYRSSGGFLNENWVLLSKLEDLIALCDLLNRSTPEMTNRIADLRQLINQTIVGA
ncbi:aminoglycoside phosphotransferase family protein [Paenibacillus sp. ACRRX]|uniref:phosphotransferase family protein n=1 Tax=unclassified Paenibacillus TaxID=185978 RepID=UPI001EF62293|nr:MULTISPECIES: aminoglycoside phosphotransferase family protein [unclassified Paenibacillus]MCG7406564.1 aminoglycoside phosphotransferase family protein [Paenibacillus sp. ACRRX]MDK8179596.1 aminoglycoside phosphotransferase family protein [Paenibacillus sp. UMB4589-SE434]